MLVALEFPCWKAHGAGGCMVVTLPADGWHLLTAFGQSKQTCFVGEELVCKVFYLLLCIKILCVIFQHQYEIIYGEAVHQSSACAQHRIAYRSFRSVSSYFNTLRCILRGRINGPLSLSIASFYTTCSFVHFRFLRWCRTSA